MHIPMTAQSSVAGTTRARGSLSTLMDHSTIFNADPELSLRTVLPGNRHVIPITLTFVAIRLKISNLSTAIEN